MHKYSVEFRKEEGKAKGQWGNIFKRVRKKKQQKTDERIEEMTGSGGQGTG